MLPVFNKSSANLILEIICITGNAQLRPGLLHFGDIGSLDLIHPLIVSILVQCHLDLVVQLP